MEGHVFIRSRRRGSQDGGFSLIEMVVALAIAMVVFAAMAAAAIAGVRATVVARQNQQAVDVLNQITEEARSVDFANLAMVSSDLQVGDSAISTGSTPSYVVPNGIGSEPVWVDSTGTVNPHVTTRTGANGISYSLKEYVTVPTGSTTDTAGQPSQKRYTVVVTWTTYGETHTRVISTLLTDTARGLPLPRYSVTATSVKTQTKNPSTVLTWGFQVVNRGARDTFNISASTGTWTYRLDEDCNGALDPGEDTALSNTDAATGNAAPDTGPLEPNNYPGFCVVASRDIPSNELGASSVVFTLTSSAQPGVDGAVVASPTYTVTVVTGSVGGGSSTPTTGTATPTSTLPSTACEPDPSNDVQGTGTTLTSFGLKNGTAGTAGNTTSTLINYFGQASCAYQAQDYNFSTEASNGSVGRSLTVGGSATSSTASQMAEWRWNPPSTKTFNGTASASLRVSCPVTGSNVTLNVAVGSFTAKTSTWASKGTGSTSVSCASANNWTRVEIPVVLTSFSVANKSQGQPVYLSMRLWTSGAGAPNLRVNYESPNAKSFLSISMS